MQNDMYVRKYFRCPQIKHAKFSCKIQCMKLSVNIQGPEEEQSFLDARSQSGERAGFTHFCDPLNSVTAGGAFEHFLQHARV